MKPASDAPSIPEELARLASQPRVQVRRAGPPLKGGRCVVYWMQRAQRIVDNPALDVAIEAGNLLGLPVVVFFSVIPNYPNANLRHYHFMAQGLRDVAEDAAARGVGFVVRRHPDHALDAFLVEVKTALLIGDENPCREPERWRKVLAARLKLPYWTVDADVVVPSAIFNRSFVLLHHFRPHLKKQLPIYLVPSPKLEPIYPWKPTKKPASYPLTEDITAGFTRLDRTVGPVDSFTGGTITKKRATTPSCAGPAVFLLTCTSATSAPSPLPSPLKQQSNKAKPQPPRLRDFWSSSSAGASFPSSLCAMSQTTITGSAPRRGLGRRSWSTPGTLAPTGTLSLNWGAPRPPTSYGTRPSGRWF